MRIIVGYAAAATTSIDESGSENPTVSLRQTQESKASHPDLNCAFAAGCVATTSLERAAAKIHREKGVSTIFSFCRICLANRDKFWISSRPDECMFELNDLAA